MTAGPPVWLLDIDGVLSAVAGKPDRSAWPADAWRRATVQGAKLLVASPVLDFIHQVHAAGRAEIRWHTTWRDGAHLVAAEFGLPEFAVAHAPECADAQSAGWWWKRPAAERVLRDEGRPLVWTDDDLVWDLGRQAQDRLRRLGPALLIAPSPLTGLAMRHLRMVGEFLDLYPAAATIRPTTPEGDRRA